MADALHAQLKGKWRHACTQYRNAHPDEMLPNKTSIHGNHTRTSSRTLPIEHARGLMRTWLPWAAAQATDALKALTDAFAALTPEEQQAVNEYPEED